MDWNKHGNLNPGCYNLSYRLDMWDVCHVARLKLTNFLHTARICVLSEQECVERIDDMC